MDDKTLDFKIYQGEIKIEEILELVYEALLEKGYNPYDQIVGYLLSGDPSYIPRHNNARKLIKLKERDQILEELLKSCLNNE